MSTSLTPHLFWITSRAAGIVALVLASLAVSLGLVMSLKLLRKRGPDLLAVHEILSLSAIVAIVVHGAALLGDGFLHPSIVDITVPFASSYKTFWTSLGIVAGWGLIVLGLSYYARKLIGSVRWRKLHRFTALLWLVGLAHSLGEGTDAGQVWFLAMIALVAVPALALLVTRWLGDNRSPKLQTGRVANDHVREFSSAAGPASPGLRQRDGVEPPAGDRHPDVVGVGVDRDPAARTGIAPVLELARDHR
jgi:methionine sulfoxide reductase heme-binding subunit